MLHKLVGNKPHAHMRMHARTHASTRTRAHTNRLDDSSDNGVAFNYALTLGSQYYNGHLSPPNVSGNLECKVYKRALARVRACVHARVRACVRACIRSVRSCQVYKQSNKHFLWSFRCRLASYWTMGRAVDSFSQRKHQNLLGNANASSGQH